jgi:hypothetical protein
MLLHADLSQRALLHTPSLAWLPSSTVRVERQPLDRQGNRLDCHHHCGGEEILMVEGGFQDEHGNWLRNPPGSAHRPWSEAGCRIWVKTGHLPASPGPNGSPA